MSQRSSHRLIRVGVLQQLDAVLASHGCDSGKVLAEAGFSPEFFRDPDNLMPLDGFARLLEHCVEVSANPDFVLQLCAVQDLELGGNLGLLMQTASSLGEALKDLMEFVHIQAQFIQWRLKLEGEFAFLCVELDGQLEIVRQRQLVIDIALAQFFKALMLLTRREVALHSVNFRSDKTESARAFREYFRAPVHFGSEFDSLVFPRSDLEKPVLHSNRMLHELVSNQVKHSGLYHAGRTLPEQVRGAIRDYLPENKCSIENVAGAMTLDVRALQRQLRDNYNTTYQELLDEVRLEIACLYLKETNMPLAQLTLVLGYTDPSTMSRALRKQLGCTPRQWRQREKAMT